MVWRIGQLFAFPDIGYRRVALNSCVSDTDDIGHQFDLRVRGAVVDLKLREPNPAFINQAGKNKWNRGYVSIQQKPPVEVSCPDLVIAAPNKEARTLCC
jgi:hypothetical protein